MEVYKGDVCDHLLCRNVLFLPDDWSISLVLRKYNLRHLRHGCVGESVGEGYGCDRLVAVFERTVIAEYGILSIGTRFQKHGCNERMS